jgi:hypothetical protein
MSQMPNERDLRDSDCGSSDSDDDTYKKPKNANSLTKSGYIDEIKIDTTIDLHNAGDTVMQARRRGRMKYYQSPDFYVERCEEMEEKVQQWTSNKATTDDLQWWGDEISTSDQWPTPMKQNVRILFANMGGISHENDFIDVDIFMQHCAENQIDIIMLTEINLNLTQGRMRKNLREAFKRYDKHMKIQFAHPHIQVDKKVKHLMGSNMIGVQGGYAGRVVWTGADKYGRWSQMALECGGKRTMLYCAYRVCTNNPTGDSTIASQEMTALQDDDHQFATKPRKAFLVDIERSILDQSQQDTEIIVGLDANSDITSSDIETLCANTGLVQIAIHKHPHLVPPRTYDRGKDRCMDIMLMSAKPTEETKATGYLPMYNMGPRDHRFPYADICHNALLRGYKPNPSTYTARKLTTSRPKVVAKWCMIAKQMLKKAGVFHRIESLEKRLEKAAPWEIEAIFQQIDKYDKTREDLYKSAANKCAPTFPNVDWSPTLAKHGTILRYWKNRQTAATEYGDYEGMSVPIPPEVEADNSLLSDEAISANLSYAQKDYNQTRYNSRDIRAAHLLDLAERAAEERNCSLESALKQIITAELSRALHQRHGHLFGKTKKGIKEIIVPIPHSEKINAWETITEPESIHNILLNANQNSLLKSANSPFATGQLFDAIGEHADEYGASELLDGTFDNDSLGDEFWAHEDIDIMTELLRNLKRKTTDNKFIQDMKWTFDSDDYLKVFSKVPERTGCGPSGLTMNF